MTSPQTSATRSATSPSIANSYRRITGGTPMTYQTGIPGPQMKPLKDSALERADAEMAARESMLPRELDLEKKKQLGMRDIMESLNPQKRFQREEFERAANAKQQDFLDKTQAMQQWLKNQYPSQGQGQPGGAKFTPQLAGRYQAEMAAKEAENARKQAEEFRKAYAQAARRY